MTVIDDTETAELLPASHLSLAVRREARRREVLAAHTVCWSKSPLRLLVEQELLTGEDRKSIELLRRGANSPRSSTGPLGAETRPGATELPVSGAVDADAEPLSSGSITPASNRTRSLWALADQGVVSLGNSFTSVLLARALVVGEYGTFSLLLEAMLFLNSLQAALVIYPLSVRGAVLNREGLRRMCGACLVLTLLLALPLGAAVVGLAGVVDGVALGVVALGALALWQCQETLRRAMMAHGGQKFCLLGDTISYGGQALGMLLLVMTGTLTVGRAYSVMALTSAMAIAVQAWQVGPKFDLIRRGGFDGNTLRMVARDFWQLGRWVMYGGLTAIVTTLACSWTLAWFHGTDAVGQFQALANLLKLSNPLTICMAGLIVPAAARAFHLHGIDSARNITLKYGALTVAALAPYYLILLAIPTALIHLLYGQTSAYAGLGNQLRVFVLWYATLLVAQIAGCFLNAIEQSRRAFVAQAAQTAAVVLIALPLIALFGLNGMLVGGVIGNIVMAATFVALAHRAVETEHQEHARLITHEMKASANLAPTPFTAAAA